MNLHLQIIILVIFTIFVYLLIIVRLVLIWHLLAVVECCFSQFVIFFIVNAALLVAIFLRSSHHALSLKLLFSHLIKPVFFVVSVRHYPSDCLGGYKLLILFTVGIVIVLRIGILVTAVELHSPSFVDLFSCGDSVLQIDRNFVIISINVIGPVFVTCFVMISF